MIEIKVKDFELDHIFDCGQSFRWNKEEDGSYTGIAFGHIANMSLKDGILSIETLSKHGGNGEVVNEFAKYDDTYIEEMWKEYLDLYTDYGEIKKYLSKKDKIMKSAISSGEGIRILKQEPWEALVSFIISQNNNIPRIKKCIEGLCESFGEPLGTYRGKQRFAFPKADVLAQLTEEDLGPIRLGYRSKYIINTAKQVVEDGGEEFLFTLREKNSQEAYEYLTSLCGVGPKVANCILLFGIDKKDSFPIDVWVKRVMNRLYDIDENDMKSMKVYAEDNFGIYGGVAQQYLFYHIRKIESEV